MTMPYDKVRRSDYSYPVAADVIERLQSIVKAMVHAQGRIYEHDLDKTINIEGLGTMLQNLDEFAWSVADVIEDYGVA